MANIPSSGNGLPTTKHATMADITIAKPSPKKSPTIFTSYLRPLLRNTSVGNRVSLGILSELRYWERRLQGIVSNPKAIETSGTHGFSMCVENPPSFQVFLGRAAYYHVEPLVQLLTSKQKEHCNDHSKNNVPVFSQGLVDPCVHVLQITVFTVLHI